MESSNNGKVRRIIVRWIAKTNGSWKHVHHQRGYWRVVLADPTLGNDDGLVRSRGTVSIIAESADYDKTTKRSNAGYKHMCQVAEKYAREHGELLADSIFCQSI